MSSSNSPPVQFPYRAFWCNELLLNFYSRDKRETVISTHIYNFLIYTKKEYIYIYIYIYIYLYIYPPAHRPRGCAAFLKCSASALSPELRVWPVPNWLLLDRIQIVYFLQQRLAIWSQRRAKNTPRAHIQLHLDPVGGQLGARWHKHQKTNW